MNKRSLRILEYNKILGMLVTYAASPMAKKRLDRLKPQTDIDIINTLQEETHDALKRISTQGNISFSGLTDIGASIKRLEVKGVLTAKELLDLAAVLELAEHSQKYGEGAGNYVDDNTEKDAIDSLTARFTELIPLAHISTEIRRCINSDGEFMDDASSALKRIRKEIRLTNERLHQQLGKLIKDDTTKDMLQDNLITMRNGRYCIPVRKEYKSHFPGMIHDRSQTGSTLFIEPLAIVNLNNEIKDLLGEEKLEMERILEEISILAAGAVEDIAYDVQILTELDIIFARAKFAKSYDGNQPIFNTEGIIDIRSGRHPLLDKHSVVPVDIKLGDGYKLLIITGPNTGGKTVSLKTLGLFTLMGQAGLHIPALYGSRLAVFSDVFADIGDEQSIEQNLSTFSSHMSNIVYIVNHATKDSLCLFDEPGGGTDPVEGAALAISILNYLKSIDARCMATTHYSELKTYALSSPEVENASCEFDVATLAPTYKLMIGVPGKSNAFAISGKLGLPKHIIDDAKKNLDSDAVDMETLISDLWHSKKEIDEEKEKIKAERLEAEQLKERVAAREAELTDKKSEIIAKAREEARELIEEAKDVADTAIRDYNKWSMNPHKANARDMEEGRSKLRDKLKDLSSKEDGRKVTQTSSHKASDFKIGDTVVVISMNTKGVVTALPDKDGNVSIQMGIMSTRIHMSDLFIQKEIAPKGPSKKTGSKSAISKAMYISPEINVIGKTVDEATMLIDKYLDDAIIAGLHKVTIIHGKGTGALRNGIHKYLKANKHVSTYRAGEFGEGEYGVTIVEL